MPRFVHHGPKVGLYLSTIATHLVLLGYVWIGVRRRKFTLRQLMGQRWRGFDDVAAVVIGQRRSSHAHW